MDGTSLKWSALVEGLDSELEMQTWQYTSSVDLQPIVT